MKAGREHRVPLSFRATAVLRLLEKIENRRFRIPWSGRAVSRSPTWPWEMMLRRMKVDDATVHGFRSSFRDWAGNVSNFPRDTDRDSH